MKRFNAPGRSDSSRGIFKDKAGDKAKDRAKAEVPAIMVGEHGRYQIKSGRLAGEYVARAFPKPPTNARGMIAEATGATEEAAIAALHDKIDAREAQRTGDRRVEPLTGATVPSIEEYVEAIGQVALSRPQRAILLALSLAGEDGLSEQGMANAAGYKTPASANRSFAGVGLLIASYLSAETAQDGSNSDLEGTSVLGFRGEPRQEGDPGNWILHAELRDAVRSAF